MESEKVKEIRDSIQRKINRAEKGEDDFVNCVSVDMLKMYLTLINELENENERLMKLQAKGGYRVAELGIENQQRKDRIAKLENTDYYKEIAGKYLKEFAEKLKECAQTNLDHFMGFQKVILTEQIDELLKEYE